MKGQLFWVIAIIVLLAGVGAGAYYAIGYFGDSGLPAEQSDTSTGPALEMTSSEPVPVTITSYPASSPSESADSSGALADRDYSSLEDIPEADSIGTVADDDMAGAPDSTGTTGFADTTDGTDTTGSVGTTETTDTIDTSDPIETTDEVSDSADTSDSTSGNVVTTTSQDGVLQLETLPATDFISDEVDRLLFGFIIFLIGLIILKISFKFVDDLSLATQPVEKGTRFSGYENSVLTED